MAELISRQSCSLLILDRCEEDIGHARTQFVWFLKQLLSKSPELKVLLATQVPLDKDGVDSGLDIGDTDIIGFTAVTVERMRPKDASLLLLELCADMLTRTRTRMRTHAQLHTYSMCDASSWYPACSVP